MEYCVWHTLILLVLIGIWSSSCAIVDVIYVLHKLVLLGRHCSVGCTQGLSLSAVGGAGDVFKVVGLR